MSELYFNQDCTEFFVANAPETMSGELVDTFVDSLAGAGVTALLTNPNGQRANYASDVRERYWDGYDPDGPDDQPCFEGYPKERLRIIRPMLNGMMRLAEMGIDFHARALQRCHQNGMQGWISVRMNDVHDVDICAGPQISRFWKEHPEFRRVPYRFTRAFDRQLDYARPEVRQHYLVLLQEVCERYDLDGLELDFMRFPHYFRIGQELAGGDILTTWLRDDVRPLVEAAAQRLGHGVRLGVRVPADPETTRLMGLDAVRWARLGLLDLVVVTPFWETSDFNLPLRQWRRLLDGTGIELAAGLEILVRPGFNGPLLYQTPETSTGAAVAALHSGADHVYLFNHFFAMPGQPTKMWDYEAAKKTLAAMTSLEALSQLPRRHILTYDDTQAPGELRKEALPFTGALGIFRLQTGPRPEGRRIHVVLGFQIPTDKPALFAPPQVRVNAQLLPGIAQVQGQTVMYETPADLMADEQTVIEVEDPDDKPFTLTWVEVAVA